ncbi:DUF1476 domain-containing protein [Oceanicella actignis]|uniref:DUF1476 domain-containing protein n=1 Tax=Oceanicella actignis TaxID=1189325 RepID=A0A1M7SD21_9RHOB|nr:DUF1476 domain-containing protein [Oceanicella actignis]TYO91398.1 hypothetical protein LY05_00250 [Oceanicella actignis]SET25625.1 hypothetical protein SAMN04488119_103265 [Oceanicella actignis]SHN56380.1 hypothetical protein SAMN05216200_102243 [Oceanicella actignis]
MTTFDEREQAFEKKFAHDAEMQFKAMARRDRLLGLWAAEKMGLRGEEAEEYAKSVVIADLEEAGDEDVYRKVAADLEAKGLPTDDLRAKMAELLAEAKAQVMSEA